MVFNRRFQDPQNFSDVALVEPAMKKDRMMISGQRVAMMKTMYYASVDVGYRQR